MGCSLASSAKINEPVDSQRGRTPYDSSEEDSDALEESPTQSKWLMNKTKGAEEKKKRAIEFRKNKLEQTKKDKINAFRKQYGNGKPKQPGKNDRTPALKDEQLNAMVVNTSFEEEVVQHIEGALTNINRKVELFPYQISGRIGLRFWGKVVIQQERFVDDIFPPNFNSLFDSNISEKMNARTLLGKRAKRRRIIYRKWKDNVVWKRPEEVYGKGLFSLFRKIDVEDVTQGELGNCYFLSCISALAEEPHRIRQIFHTKTVTQSGAYAVQYYINGEPIDIVVDDFFPYDVRPEQDNWIFSRCTQEKEIWVQVLEKAYAKVFGSYEVTEGGKPYQAFGNLTGFPSDVIYHNEMDYDVQWKVLLDAAKYNFPMVSCVNSLELGEAKAIKAKGLADHHAYTLLTALSIIDEDGTVLRLIKIRNPYGTRAKREWQQDWHEESLGYMKKVHAKLGVNDDRDGIFWISFEHFIKFFYCTAVCLYQDNYQQICLSDTHGQMEHALTKLIVHEDIEGVFIIQLHQIHRRFLETWLEGKYQYATMQLYLARVDRVGVHTPDHQFDENTETVKLIDGHRGVDMPVIYIKRKKIKAGEYLIFYRAAFNATPGQAQGTSPSNGISNKTPAGKKTDPGKAQNLTPVSAVSSKIPESLLSPAEAPGYSSVLHPQRKLVLSLLFPNSAKLQMQRIETEPFYGKDVFIRMRRHYKMKFERGVIEEEVDAV